MSFGKKSKKKKTQISAVHIIPGNVSLTYFAYPICSIGLMITYMRKLWPEALESKNLSVNSCIQRAAVSNFFQDSDNKQAET